jgi:squalene/oxidosqualene cyclase-like protein
MSTIPRKRLEEALRAAVAFLAGRQQPDGSLVSPYGGPGFLLPMYVIAVYIAKRPLSEERKRDMVRGMLAHQNADGSLGLHELDSGCMFTSVLGYVALRLLGESPEQERMTRLRQWIKKNGGAVGAASWGKFMLALVNLYEWEGVAPLTPEMWLLPYFLPFHPGRFWCHCRMVYLPMSWLYGRRVRAPLDPLLEQLRTEIYCQPYEEIDFRLHRHTIAPGDNRYPLSTLARTAFRVLDVWERAAPRSLRRRAQAKLLEQIEYEDRATDFIRIGPVNAVLNTLVHHFNNPGGPEEVRSFQELENYLVMTPEGLKFNGYNSTALWDTAFAAQAVAAARGAAARDFLERAHSFIDANQVREDLPQHRRFYRHASRGGWPFSNLRHGWPITDCTAEGIKAALALRPLVAHPLSDERLLEAVALILSFQNRDGGWATYERKRAGDWLEMLNPSQVFWGIMTDYSYVECTSACLQALAAVRHLCPPGLAVRVERAIRRGTGFLRAQQMESGGFYGSWAVCFTYGTWFAVWGLTAGGAKKDDPSIAKALGFLLAHQNADGGFGEHFTSCRERRWIAAPSTPSQTAWGLLALVRGGLVDSVAAGRAAEFLLRSQQPDGDWPQEPLVGVFNRTTLINYENYRRTFPIWALAEYGRLSAKAGAGSE